MPVSITRRIILLTNIRVSFIPSELEVHSCVYQQMSKLALGTLGMECARIAETR